MFTFFTGRSNRQEYWISVGLLIVAALVLSLFQMQAASAAITIMWIITWMRRLHDTGRTGLWAALPIGLLFILVGGVIAFGGNDFANTLRALEMGNDQAVSQSSANLFLGVALAALIIQFGFTIWLGSIKGDARENRFGPPPGTEPR